MLDIKNKTSTDQPHAPPTCSQPSVWVHNIEPSRRSFASALQFWGRYGARALQTAKKNDESREEDWMKIDWRVLTLPSHCQHWSPGASAWNSFVSVGTLQSPIDSWCDIDNDSEMWVLTLSVNQVLSLLAWLQPLQTPEQDSVSGFGCGFDCTWCCGCGFGCGCGCSCGCGCGFGCGSVISIREVRKSVLLVVEARMTDVVERWWYCWWGWHNRYLGSRLDVLTCKKSNPAKNLEHFSCSVDISGSRSS